MRYSRLRKVHHLDAQLDQDRISELGYLYFEVTNEGLITRINPQLSRTLGYGSEEIAGRHFRRLLASENLREFVEAFQRSCQGGGPQQLSALGLRGKNGIRWTGEGTLASVKTGSGGPSLLACLLRDSSERMRSERELIKAKEAAERELEIGREIQSSFLPEELPTVEGWEIESYFKAARVVSGDFYDAFILNTTRKLCFVVADVCDKGVGAALFMGLFRSLVRAYADQPYSLSWMDVLSDDAGSGDQGGALGRRRSMLSAGTAALKSTVQQTNDYIAKTHGETSMFATMFLGMLDPDAGQLMYINGGQHAALLQNPGEKVQLLSSTGPAVGLMPGMSFHIGSVEVRPGGMLLAYTDGVPDALDPEGVFFGQERVERIFARGADSAEGMTMQLGQAIQGHVAGADQFDDVTFMVLRRTSD
jgi:sigma-B regulation protein RsbU (phosphoserine phosphatase)